MNIMLANVAIAERDDPFAVNVLSKQWKRNFDLVRRPDTRIVSRFSNWGIVGMEGFFYPAIDLLNAQAVLQACRGAQDDGFDGILITCHGDPMLDQIRSLVDIPVVGLGEASYRLAATMGKRFGLVTISPSNIYECWHTIEKYGLNEYCAGIEATPEPPEEQPGALIHAGKAIESFRVAARRLIAQGAEVLIPGCGLMSPALRLAPGCADQYPDGVTEVDGVPVVDVLSAGLLALENLIALRKAASPWISRAGVYRMPPASALESGRMVLADGRQQFWDLEL